MFQIVGGWVYVSKDPSSRFKFTAINNDTSTRDSGPLLIYCQTGNARSSTFLLMEAFQDKVFSGKDEDFRATS